MLMAVGLLVGLALTLFLVAGGHALGLTWLASVAVAKLSFVSSIGLMGCGAALHRLDRKRRARTIVEASTESEGTPLSTRGR
jgi:hypothetical protein